MQKILTTIQKIFTTVFIIFLIPNIFIIPVITIFTPVISMAAESEPEMVLKNGVNEMITVLNDPAFVGNDKKNAKKESLLNKAESIFDFSEFSRGALGKNWERFSENQRAEFTQYFSKLIANTYTEKIDDENFQDLKITYLKTEKLDSTKSGIERADITTEVFHNKIITPVYYRMMKKPKESWKIYDVKIEGVSMVGNYREQYRTRFNDSPDKIIKEIKEKIGK